MVGAGSGHERAEAVAEGDGVGVAVHGTLHHEAVDEGDQHVGHLLCGDVVG